MRIVLMSYILILRMKRLHIFSLLIPQITIHRKTQEHCSEEIIIHKLKQYISEFKDSINKCEEQLEIYTCHLHSSIHISHIGDLVIDLEVQALKTGVTIVKQFNYFWLKSLI